MKEQFEVIEIQSQTMKLKVNRASGCHSCSANNSCGTGILSKHFEHYSVFTRPRQTGVVVGDLVSLEISSKTLFYRAFQLYMLPLLALFAGGILGDVLYPEQETLQIAFAFSGFFSALLLTKYFVK